LLVDRDIATNPRNLPTQWSFGRWFRCHIRIIPLLGILRRLHLWIFPLFEYLMGYDGHTVEVVFVSVKQQNCHFMILLYRGLASARRRLNRSGWLI
jgi:hypothetical protein